MGNKTSQLKQERVSTAKSTNFQSRFLYSSKSPGSGLETPNTPSGADQSLEVRSFNSFISSKEFDQEYLTASNLLSFLQDSKTEGIKTFFSQKSTHKIQRKQFLSKLSHWGKKYEDLCTELRDQYNLLIIKQHQDLEKSLEETGKLVLRNYKISEELLTKSLIRHSSNIQITKLIHSLNSFEIIDPPNINIQTLYEILEYKILRMQVLSSLVWTADAKHKFVVICYVLSDEIETEYSLDEDHLNSALRAAVIDPKDSLLPRFKELQFQFENLSRPYKSG